MNVILSMSISKMDPILLIVIIIVLIFLSIIVNINERIKKGKEAINYSCTSSSG